MPLKIILTLLSAGLAILAFPPFGIWPLALLAWIPLLWVLQRATSREGFYCGLLHGVVLFGGTLSWLWEIFGRASLGLWGLLALFTAFSALLIVGQQQRSPVLRATVVATIWTGLEVFRSEYFKLAFPWITPGTGLLPNWATSVVGVYGVTFLIILGGGLVLCRWKIGVPMLALLAVSVMIFNKVVLPERTLRVGLVQDETAIVETLEAVSEEFLADVDVVVWPEYSLGEIREEDIVMAQKLAGSERLFIGCGMETRDEVTGNTAITVAAEGVIGRHIKNHPVHFFADGIKGETAFPVSTDLGVIGTPICFDCDHQDVIRKMTAAGAEVFLIPSMDAMEWSARQHEQHGILFRHRAAENGRWLAVASTSGVTQVLDSHGQVVTRLPLMEAGSLVGEVGLLSQRTLFQRGGWLFGPLTMAVTLCLLGQSLWWYSRKKRGAKGS